MAATHWTAAIGFLHSIMEHRAGIELEPSCGRSSPEAKS